MEALLQGPGWTAVWWNSAPKKPVEEMVLGPFTERPAAAAQVSLMTVIVLKESSCNCGSTAIQTTFSCKVTAFVSAALTLPFIRQAALR